MVHSLQAPHSDSKWLRPERHAVLHLLGKLLCAGALALSGTVHAAAAEAAPSDATPGPSQWWKQPWPPVVVASPATCQTRALQGSARTFDVGPGREHADLNTVPWLSLAAGDVVNIYPRDAPYATKFALRAQGSAEQPVIINGVTDAKCNRPTISGAAATTAIDAAASGYFETPGGQIVERLGTIVIYRGAQDAYGYRPAHIRIQNLKITGGSSTQKFISHDVKPLTYTKGAAGIYAVAVANLTIENCEITRNDNGIFVNTKNEGLAETSSHVTLRFNRIEHNGVAGSYLEHNVYMQAVRPLIEGNYIGQLIAQAKGSSLKDRSSGSVVRYNHIVAAARALDLVEAEGGLDILMADPLYPDAWVYGNLIVSDWDNPGLSSAALIHWGGDNTPKNFRTGTLHFYRNTVLSRLAKGQFWYVSIFDMPSPLQRVDAWDNVFAHYRNADYRLGTGGKISLSGTNWLPKGWLSGAAAVQTPGRIVEGSDVKLNVDASLQQSSSAVDKASSGDGPAYPAAANAAALRPTHSYRHVARIVPRLTVGTMPDLGAFEYSLESIAIPFEPN